MSGKEQMCLYRTPKISGSSRCRGKYIKWVLVWSMAAGIKLLQPYSWKNSGMC